MPLNSKHVCTVALCILYPQYTVSTDAVGYFTCKNVHLSLLGGHFAHWLQGILVCQKDPALPEAPEVPADQAHPVDLVLFVPKQTDWESG